MRHPAGISAQEVRARLNTEIFTGDSIATAPDGAAKILFTDNSVIDVSGSSLFRVEHFEQRSTEGRNALFRLLQGKLRLLVSKVLGSITNFRVVTKDALLGVHGTEFVVNVGSLQNPVPTEVTVVSGLVAVSLPETKNPEVLLQPNMQWIASQNIDVASVASSLPSAQVQSIHEAAVVENRAFNIAASVDGDNQEVPGDTMATKATEAVLSETDAKAPSGQDVDQNFRLGQELAEPAADLLPGNYLKVEVLLK